ncbi:hypothetical protein [Chryseobacterium binzhouense]|uniref:hypothetical protein n=1 Tax=Chryseobacterium binzhouense TaxID=2593646 RepID=UPI00289FC18A|nr:hypothetical protein [Chryseobacterium binzhouense]
MEFLKFLNIYIVPLGVLFTVFASVINISYTRKNLKTTKYIDTISSERIKWLTIIRTEISELIAIISETLIYHSEVIKNIESQDLSEEHLANVNFDFQVHYFDSLNRDAFNFNDKLNYNDLIKRLYILKLRFNPNEDVKILNNIQFFINFYKTEYKSKEDIQSAYTEIDFLVINTQSMLKIEWEKVKRESIGKLK